MDIFFYQPQCLFSTIVKCQTVTGDDKLEEKNTIKLVFR